MLLPLLLATLAQKGPADLIITNARIWTDGRVIEGDSIAVTGGKFTYVGKSTPDLVGPKTEIVNAQRHLVIPGLIDSHSHLADHGDTLLQLQLKGTATKEEFLQRVKDYAAKVKPGGWIIGRGWSAEDWPTKEQPTKEWLDPITGDRPTVLRRMDGHSSIVNTAALVAAHIDKNGPPDPPGGVIDRDPTTHEPTGMIRDNALDLIPVPATSPEDKYNGLVAAIHEANSHGVTACSDICDISEFEYWKKYAQGKPTIRVSLYGNVEGSWPNTIAKIKAWQGVPGWAEAKGIKAYMDGSLGSRTAWMHDPYTTPLPGQTSLTGVPRPGATDGTYAKGMPLAAAAGLQVIVHAIGDQANHNILDIYASVPGIQTRRFRVEHAQHLLPADIARFGQLGVIASMQPYHKADDGRYADTIIGPERTKSSYAYHSLLATGARLAFGSDWPVVTNDPFAGIETAVTGRIIGGSIWHPEQNIPFDTALTCYTANGAFAMERDKDLGHIAPGFRADFVILNDWPYQKGFDYSTLKPEEVFVDGRVVFSRTQP
jgi:predicted amidohydrolase YtcJ